MFELAFGSGISSGLKLCCHEINLRLIYKIVPGRHIQRQNIRGFVYINGAIHYEFACWHRSIILRK